MAVLWVVCDLIVVPVDVDWEELEVATVALEVVAGCADVVATLEGDAEDGEGDDFEETAKRPETSLAS